jgi:type IV secretion system protein VirB4
MNTVEPGQDLQFFKLDEADPILKQLQKAIVSRLKDSVNRIFEQSNIVNGGSGYHALGTPVLMKDGTVKLAEDIKVGDLLMGPDSTGREVTRLYRGQDQMYRITPVKGESFILSANQILALTTTPRRKGRPREITNVSVLDYFEKSKSPRWKQLHKLYRAGPIDFGNEKPLPINPYFLGIFLGDGGTGGGNSSPNITTPDPEVVDAIYRQAKMLRLRVNVYQHPPGNKAKTYRFSTGQRRKINPITAILRALNLECSCEEKHIPLIYKTASLQKRKHLLAGLIDSDGCRNSFNGYEYLSKSKKLASDVAFVARSLGFAAYIKRKIVKGNPYWRVNISGDTIQIPCKLKRKKSKIRRQIKSVLVTGFEVESLGNGPYYGFEIGHDHLYLMGDFTVAHGETRK